jgi:hypothetical protein
MLLQLTIRSNGVYKDKKRDRDRPGINQNNLVKQTNITIILQNAFVKKHFVATWRIMNDEGGILLWHWRYAY